MEYKRHDILERTADARRVRILKVDTGPEKKILIRGLDSGKKSYLCNETLERGYANLTAQEDGRYEELLRKRF